jgi:hypothetical protein
MYRDTALALSCITRARRKPPANAYLRARPSVVLLRRYE